MISISALTIGFLIEILIKSSNKHSFLKKIIKSYIDFFENHIRTLFKKNNDSQQFIAGFILSVTFLFFSFLFLFLFLFYANKIHPYLLFFLEIYFSYRLLSIRELQINCNNIYKDLQNNNKENSKIILSNLVGRNISKLSNYEIVILTIETIATQICDKIIAPLIYMSIGGIPLGFLYVASNYFDFFIGHKNKNYYDFGKFSAKLDDVLNYIPAFISTFFILLSSLFLSFNVPNGIKIFFRDRKKSNSINNGKMISVMAGVLNIQLGRKIFFRNKLYKDRTIGDKNKKVSLTDISRANGIMYLVCFISLITIVIIRIFISNLFKK